MIPELLLQYWNIALFVILHSLLNIVAGKRDAANRSKKYKLYSRLKTLWHVIHLSEYIVVMFPIIPFILPWWHFVLSSILLLWVIWTYVMHRISDGYWGGFGDGKESLSEILVTAMNRGNHKDDPHGYTHTAFILRMWLLGVALFFAGVGFYELWFMPL